MSDDRKPPRDATESSPSTVISMVNAAHFRWALKELTRLDHEERTGQIPELLVVFLPDGSLLQMSEPSPHSAAARVIQEGRDLADFPEELRRALLAVAEQTGRSMQSECLNCRLDLDGTTDAVELRLISYPLCDASGRLASIAIHLLELSPESYPDNQRRTILKHLAEDLRQGLDTAHAAEEILLAQNDRSKTMEQVLHNREQVYRHVIENAGSMILQFDAMGRLILCNQQAREILGYSEAELHSGGVISLETVFPDLEWRRQPPEMVLAEQLQTEQGLQHSESLFLGRDGKRRWIAWTNRILVNQTGTPTGVLSVGTDITDRKHYEAHRSQQLEVLQGQADLLDLIHESIVFRTMEGTITFWNQGAQNTFGWSTEEAIDRNLRELLKAQLPEPETAIVDHLCKYGTWEGEIRYETQDGEEVITDSRWFLRRDREGTANGILQMSRNISREKQVESALRISEEQCRMALIGTAEGVWDYDLKKRRMYVSALGRGLLRLSKDSGYHNIRWWLAHIAPEDRPLLWRAVREHLEGRRHHFSVRVRIIGTDGQRQEVLLIGMAFAENGAPYRFIGTVRRTEDPPAPPSDPMMEPKAKQPAGGACFPASPQEELQMVGKYISQVMTEVVDREADLQREQERLQANEKLLTVGRLAASVAHEIRNPITAMRMRLHTLRTQLQAFPDAQEDTVVIADELTHLERIITQFLEFSRPREPELQRVSLTKVLEDVMLLMGRQFANHQISVIRDVDSAPVLWTDPDQLKQVFVNLMKNAMDAMPDGGQLTVAAQTGGGRLHVRFTDVGKGIAPEHVDKIFDPFFSARQGGTGLGLSTCARILQSLGGAIALEKTDSAGTVFTVFLPLAEEPRPSGPEDENNRRDDG